MHGTGRTKLKGGSLFFPVCANRSTEVPEALHFREMQKF
mgnify:CR=1 FL=1